jgi:diguanylate cyclase
MSAPLRALIVEDSEDDALLLIRELEKGGYEVTYERVETQTAMSAALDLHSWGIIFADYTMPEFSGTEALRVVQDKGLDVPFIFVSGTMGEDVAVSAMKTGAHDYIMKSNLKRLIPAVQRELREAKIRQDHRRAEETIYYLAYYDPLTSLPNRSLLLDRLQQAVLSGQRKNQPVAFMLLDIDRFSEINDTLGYHCGDRVLQQVGTLLKELLRKPDTVSRLEGDEFAVLLPTLEDTAHVDVVIQKILKALETPFMIEGLPISVEVSLGVAFSPDHGKDADTLMQHADVAMHTAKKTGSAYAVYTPEQYHYSPRRLVLMGELRGAIDGNQLLLHYQPKISLKTSSCIGLEALVRWQHPVHGFIPPDQFIGPSELTGLILPLTRWVFDAAQRQCLILEQEGKGVPVSINVSARSLFDRTLPDQLQALITAVGGTAGQIEFEITESAIMADPTHALEIILRLKEMGIRFAIDDFGMGYSSLSYLKRLPVEELKIDKSFILGMATDAQDAVIVRSTIDLAHNMGLEVVAEGVEDQETWNRLVVLGCDTAQGYFMSRPLPAKELIRWLNESPWGLKK